MTLPFALRTDNMVERARGQLVLLLSLVLVVAGLVTLTPGPAEAAGTYQVEGQVFRDFNSNGAKDPKPGAAPDPNAASIASDVGLAGVVVTAVDAKGALVGDATTDASGAYTLDVEDPWSEQVRVEFAVPAGYESSFHGTDSGTSVQFVKLVTGSVTKNVDFAVNAPEDYSNGVVPLVSPIHTAGLSTHLDNVGKPSLVSIPWGAKRNDLKPNPVAGQPAISIPDGDYSERTVLGRVEQTGALWGMAFQRTTGDLFAAATLRRHADLGPLGLGGIYRVEDAVKDGSINPDKAATATAGPEEWLNVSDPAGLNIDVGTVDSAVVRDLKGPKQASSDVAAVASAGKVGIGGIAVSSDGKVLYFMNLKDKKVYAINIATKKLAGKYALDLATGERPWALTVRRGKVYVGSVETGEGTTPVPAASTLDMVVRSAPESAFKTADESEPTWTEVLRDDLGYDRGAVWSGTPAIANKFKKWHAWVDDWDADDHIIIADSGATSWAQAVLTDLQFTTSGDMVLGMQDRYALQTGDRNFGPSGAGKAHPTMSAGDILIAGPVGDKFAMEDDGTVSGRSTTAGRTGEGPGGREFFNDENFFNPATTHKEITLGGLATLAGVNQVVSTAFDPTASFRTSGLSWFSTVNGSVEKGYQHTPESEEAGVRTGNFAKGGGIGDIQALADAAPLEIGNRVWFDADRDGIQDADEPAVAGVRVQLFAADVNGDATGTAISSTITDADGEYYFDADPNTRYVVVFTPPTGGDWVTKDARFGTVKWSDITFTKKPTVSAPSTDSNVDGDGHALVVTGGPGQNDHTIDAGLIADASFTIQKHIHENSGEVGDDQQFTINFEAKDFRGDVLPLTQSSVTLDPNDESAPFTVPVGTWVKVTENATGIKSVTIAGPAGSVHANGFYLVEGNTRASIFVFTVTNELFRPGEFTVSKVVTGDFDLTAARLADAEFTVHYEYPGGSGDLVLNKSNGWSLTSRYLPYGAVVTLSEPTISGQHPSVEFGTPSWKVDTGAETTAATKQFTVGDGILHSIVLTNRADEIFGGFDLTKAVTGPGASRVPDDFKFLAEYSLDAGSTWIPLAAVTKDDPTVVVPKTIPVGTKVLIREKTPAAIPGVQWASPAFSGVGVTAAVGVAPASFVIAKNTSLAVTLTNSTSKDGQFTITKAVTGPGEKLVKLDPTFTVNWTMDGVAQPAIALKNKGVFTSKPMSQGTKVTITEVTPSGNLPKGATWGTPVLKVDGVSKPNGTTFDIGDETQLLEIVLVNSTDVEPEVEITKGDGDAPAAKIVHEADTVHEGEFYQPGETRDIVIRVDNPGPEPLREVKLTDITRSGGDIVDLQWTFPDGSSVAADWDAAKSTWNAKWAATYAPGTTMWAVGDVIIGRAKLTVDAPQAAHQDRVRVDAVGAYSGKKVDDDNDYNAFTAAIQLIKYDGNKPDPAVKDSNGNWITPVKPLADPMQDANDTEHSVEYVAKKSNKVRWVATNTGPTTLTRITLADVTGFGPDIGADWTSNLTAFGGPADYSFVKDGPWDGLFPPGASFFSRGTLTLPAKSKHGDTVTVTGVPVVPATNVDGTPSNKPLLKGGKPVLVLDAKGNPVVLTDDDPFHAHTPAKPLPPGRVKSEEGEAGELPDTGAPMGPWAPLGGLLLLAGGLGLVLASRQTAAAAPGRHRI